MKFRVSRILLISLVVMCFGIGVAMLVGHMQNTRIHTSRLRMTQASGYEQANLILKNSPYLCEKIDVGTSSSVVLDILGPPMNSESDLFWFYPRFKTGEKGEAAFYLVIKSGRVIEPVNKTVAVDFERSYKHLDAAEYHKAMHTVRKYVYGIEEKTGLSDAN